MKTIIKNYLTYTLTIFSMLIFSLFLLNTAFASEFIVSAINSNKIIGVRLQDFNRHLPQEIKLLSKHLEQAKLSLNSSYPGNIVDIFFSAKPYKIRNEETLPLTALINTNKTNHYFFIELNLSYNSINNQYQIIYNKLTDLNDTYFEIKVSLKDRKMILQDSYSNIKMVFPIGVGAFDENILNNGISIITPRFKNAFLDKKAAIASRKKPRYFMKKPFLRITTSEDVSEGRTNIGFHVQPNLDRFIRAFDSHGCMRMQTPDLEMLHNILRYGPHQRLKVLVKYTLNDTSEHPFPKRNKSYKSIVNIGTKEEPVYTLDKDLLVQLKRVKKDAPIENLIDQDGDDYHGIFDYVMSWRNKEYLSNAKKRCARDNPSTATLYKFDDSKYIFDNTKYIVKWQDYKPVSSNFDSEKLKAKKLKKAKKAFKKAKKKAKKTSSKAQAVLKSKRIKEKRRVDTLNKSLVKKVQDSINKCMLKYQRKTSFSDRVYRWWVH